MAKCSITLCTGTNFLLINVQLNQASIMEPAGHQPLPACMQNGGSGQSSDSLHASLEDIHSLAGELTPVCAVAKRTTVNFAASWTVLDPTRLRPSSNCLQRHHLLVASKRPQGEYLLCTGCLLPSPNLQSTAVRQEILPRHKRHRPHQEQLWMHRTHINTCCLSTQHFQYRHRPDSS